MTAEETTEVLFYHLERAPLERVLPDLLERSLERGWRAVVQASSDERIDALDSLLWTFRDESFLPHGTVKDGDPALQPVFLTTGESNPNGAQIRFFVDGAETADLSPYARAVFLFDGHDEAMVSQARGQWRAAQDAGHEVTYWQQSQSGKWEKKA